MILEHPEIQDERQYSDYCLDNNGKSIEQILLPEGCPFSYCPYTFNYCNDNSNNCPSKL